MFGEQKWLTHCGAKKVSSYNQFCKKINTIFQENESNKYLLGEKIILNGIAFNQYSYLEVQQYKYGKLIKAKYYVFLGHNDFVKPEMQKKVYTSSYILRNAQNYILAENEKSKIPQLINNIQTFFTENKAKTINEQLSKAKIAAVLEKADVNYTLTIHTNY